MKIKFVPAGTLLALRYLYIFDVNKVQIYVVVVVFINKYKRACCACLPWKSTLRALFSARPGSTAPHLHIVNLPYL